MQNEVNKFNEIVNGVYELYTEFWNRKLSLYFIDGVENTIIIDSGTSQMPEDLIFPNINSFLNNKKQVDFLINTHCHVDHAGGNKKLREKYKSIKILSHIKEIGGIENFEIHWDSIFGNLPECFEQKEEFKKELRELAGKETLVDIGLTEGVTINTGNKILEVVYTPGHTEGSISIVDKKDKIIFTGECLFGNGVKDINGKIICPPYYFNAKGYLSTLMKISNIDVDIMCTSHDGVLKGKEIYDLIEEGKKYFNSVNTFIVSFLGKNDKPVNPLQIAENYIDSQIGFEFTGFVFKQILAHLEYLEEEKFVKRIIDKEDINWMLNI